MNELQNIGKLPPSDVQIEEAVIGSVMIDEDSLVDAMAVIKTEDLFYKETNKTIFKAIQKLYENNQSVDMLTVSTTLKTMGKLEEVGGYVRLVDLVNNISTGKHIEYHVRILQQSYIKRELIKKYTLLVSRAYNHDSDVFELLDYDAKVMDKINEEVFRQAKEKSYEQSLIDVTKRVEMLSNQKEGEFTGVPTGFRKLDKFTGGWQPSDLIIVAARPGMGKTAFILKNLVECGKLGVPAGMFSLEMSIEQLAARTIAINSNFHLSQIIRDGFEKAKYFTTLNTVTQKMKGFPIYINDNAALDIRDIITQARIWKRKFDIKILFVDYIQLVTDKTKGNNREQEIASISRNLKMLAKELSIPVIALSQLSRAVETRNDKRPKLSDLRESGAIEQDADIVSFLYREHYYNPDAILPDWLSSINANAEYSIAKYRSGSLGTKGLFFDENKVKYLDPSELSDAEINELESSPSSFVKPNDDNPF